MLLYRTFSGISSFLFVVVLTLFPPRANRWGVLGMSEAGKPPLRRVLEDAKAFHTYAAASVELSDAHVGSNGLLTVIRSVRDIDQGKRRRYLYSIPIVEPKSINKCLIPPVELPDTILARIPSPTGDKVAIFREEIIKDHPKRKQVLEVWSQGGQTLLRRNELHETLHGKLIFDGTGFGNPSWNNKETALVYIAERETPKTSTFFDDHYDELIEDQHLDKDVVRGGKNTLGLGKTEKWGEKYFKHSALLDLFFVNVETGRVEKLGNCPGANDTKSTEGSYTLGQPCFSSDDESIVYTAWDAGGGTDMPRRLGLIYCQQRPSKIYASPVTQLMARLAAQSKPLTESELDGAAICLTLDSRIARSPRFSPTEKNTNGASKLVFLCSDRGFDTHSGCLGLQAMDWKQGKPLPSTRRTLVKEVWNPNDSSASSGAVLGMLFPGLFLLSLAEYSFLSSKFMLLTTQWGSSTRMVRVALDSGELKVISTGEVGHYSDALLCASEQGGVTFQTTAPNRVPVLWHVPVSVMIESTTLLEGDKTPLCQMLPIASSKYSAVTESPDLDFNCDIQLLGDLPKIDAVKNYGIPVHTILLLPNLSKHPNPALIVVPHGGPHSISSVTYLASYAYLCGYGGYAVALVNYRGSTGFGQCSLESLPSRIGKLDVEDVVAATLKIRDSGLVDPNRIGICGGSHGGFLTGHCTGQYPDLFRVAAMRNPVVNIPSMTTATDIPDWCFVEALGHYDWQDYRPPTPDEMQVMWEKSPIRYIQNVKAPTLVALGLKDLRVPPSQGLEWFYTLRARRVRTKLLLYDDDDHAIGGTQAEADHWINVKRWFDENL